MNYENRKPIERPPLGKIRDLNKEEAEKRLAFEHLPLERHGELIDALRGIGSEINSLRKDAGVPELQFHDSDVRLISEEQWGQFVKDAHIQEDNGAFWDPLTEKCYLKYSLEKYNKSRLEKVLMMYSIAHEMGHKTLPGLENYSFHLSEGLADFVAKISLERGVFPSVLTPAEHAAKADYIKIKRPEVEGFVLEPGDIIIEEPEQGAVAYSRLPQLYLVKKLQETDPKAFNKLLMFSYSGDPERLKQLIEQTWGHDFAEKIVKLDIDVKHILPTIGV